MDIEKIRERVRAGMLLIQSHAVQHALKEGFEGKHMVEAVLTGTIIEEYPEDHRALICGKTALTKKVALYLHVVCEYADPVYVEFVTAYIPDDLEWEKPPFRRRGTDKKK
ncbi:MAG: hypothetical protein DMG15_13685 [Acidobacteria bacterium]|nr:MAG: hypothetical protein DMG16_03595 [Acidobacteriota bacterium]PYS12629.1 MAG: hypothetical protein DMG15_13685 [Acidobacteriota bacterium]